MAKPSSSSAVAGAGTGIEPWAVRTMPPPIGNGAMDQLAGPMASSRAAAVTISAMESIAPTSWKVTSSTGQPWTRASASARVAKMPMAWRLVSGGRADASSKARMSRQAVWWW